MSYARDTNTSATAEPGLRTAGEDLGELLELAVVRLETLGSEYAPDRDRLMSLMQRLREQQLHLAVLGQFKRGKSTLLNALIGADILPAAVVPLTAVPTLLRWGPDLSMRVFYQDDHRQERFDGESTEDVAARLARYVSEEGNPHNRMGVAHVEVTYPSPFLSDGVVLIDTPGIGSTLRHNTEATLDFLPQCDAALFLVSADPPMTQAEMEFLKAVRAKVPRLFFVLNKVDYLSPEELEHALRFLRRLLEKESCLTDDTPVFTVSARQGLEAVENQDADLWQRSGLPELQEHLSAFLRHEKGAALERAVALKAADSVAGSLAQVRLAIRSLELPLSELERRARLLQETVDQAREQALAAKDRLRGDRERTVAFLEEQAAQLRERSRAHLIQAVQEHLGDGPGQVPDEKAAGEALAAAIPEFFQRELETTAEELRARVTAVLHPHQERADDLIELVRSTAAELFEVPYRAPESSEAFEAGRRPFWVTHKWNPIITPIPEEVLDKLLPARMRRKRVLDRLGYQIESLVRHNVENLRWATLQDLNEAFRQFGLSLDERLRDTVAATQGAVQAAWSKRRERAEGVAEEKERLLVAARELASIGNRLRDLAGLAQ
ncbi:MAG: Dynamin family protein [Anaerolineae bacterium]|nr:Dynamin family protein [Anaerolineae bacterium]